jgi:hypothetical protein
MAPLIALLILIGLAVLWAFFAFIPQWVNARAVTVFNWSALFACAMICASWVFYMNVLLSPETLEKYRVALATVGALLIEIVFLGIMFLLRNFWIFKAPKRGGWGS